MPFYRHECEACGHRFRVLVLPGTEAPASTCPKCGHGKTHRLMPLVAVQFKGSGYYKTDYRGGRTKKASNSSEPDGDASASKTSEKSTSTSGDED